MNKLLLTVLFPILLWAQSSSENFSMTKSVIDAGGTTSESENFHLVSAFGQPTPVGIQSSEDFILSAGFLSPEFMVSPLSPIQDLVIQPSGNNIILNWSLASGANSYKIYRDTTTTVMISALNLVGISADTFFVDVNAQSLPFARYCYAVEASSDPPSFAVRQSHGHVVNR